MKLDRKMEEMRSRVDAQLDALLSADDGREGRLVEAMRYSVLAGGKRIRPALCLASYEAVGGTGDRALPTAAALELIHAYSLVHDDLPCMDDDDVRRGRPSTHRAYGEGMAVLVGDALLTLAFDVLATSQGKGAGGPAGQLDVLKRIADAAGIHGMIGGQVADLAAEATPLDPDLTEYVLARKTGALIAVSAWAGARLGTDDPVLLEAVERYGGNMGLAFQVVDDILDYGDPPEPANYAACHGLDRARERATVLTRDAGNALAPLGSRGETLRGIAHLILARIK